MHRGTLKCHSIYTPVIAEGRWVEEQIPSDGNKHVVILIPGNPGIPEFYLDFVKLLKERLPTETPVWLVPHAGHASLRDGQMDNMPDNPDNMRYYDLSGQVQHKVGFITDHVPKDAVLHIVGHSIGAYIALELLRKEVIHDRVIKSYMLFPTLERMAESRNGYFFTNIVARLSSILIFLAWIFTFFPLFLQTFLIRLFGLFYGIPAKDTRAVLQLLKPKVLHNVIFLAKDEMKQVCTLDHQHVSKNADKLWLYYGASDGWVPVSYYHEFVSAHPNVKAELCTRGYQHSFTLKHSKEIANIVGDVINENIVLYDNQKS